MSTETKTEHKPQADTQTTAIDVQALLARVPVAQGEELQQITTQLHWLVANDIDHRAEAWLGLGIVAVRNQQWQQAEDCFRRALAANAKLVQAKLNLGHVLRTLGRTEQARQAYNEAIELQPGYADAHYALASLLDAEGKVVEAEKALRKALLFRPAYPEALNDLGHLSMKAGKVEQALSHFRQALALRGDLLPARRNLVIGLYRLGRETEAEMEIARLLTERPGDSEILRVQAAGLVQQGHFARAAEIYRMLLEREPEVAEVHLNLGKVLTAQRDFDGALACYRNLLDRGLVAPAIGVGALANVRLAQGHFAEAKALFHQALMLDARLPDLNLGLARTLLAGGEFRLGLETLRKAVDLFPLTAEVHSLLIDALRRTGESAQLDEEMLRWRKRHDRGLRLAVAPRPGKPEEALRLGFVVDEGESGQALANLLEHLDDRRFEAHVYLVSRAMDKCSRLQQLAAHWRPATGLGCADLAEQIRQDSIDVLIEMIGHRLNSRLQALTEQPAPLQLSWLGDDAPSGLMQIEGRLLGPTMDETGAAMTLPALLPWSPSDDEASAETLPRRTGKTAVLGVLSPVGEVDERCLDVWAEILRARPEAKLRWLTDVAAEDTETPERLRRLFLLRDVAAERLELMARHDDEAYRRQMLAGIDLVLDSLCEPLGARALPVLWAGRPVLTLASTTSWQRRTSSLLSCSGMEEWVATSTADYVARAAAALEGNTLPDSDDLRARLRASPIMDGKGFAQAFATAIETAWAKLTGATAPASG